jgi:hypothetical protein
LSAFAAEVEGVLLVAVEGDGGCNMAVMAAGMTAGMVMLARGGCVGISGQDRLTIRKKGRVGKLKSK